ncbi:DUF6520 family protein [Fulvivirgaceae bacterium BMA12]|uniref:DUF6520 family protein n=1 Tax=Agaribacillus aureus TaxID=3051825 RepID=A0ABT8LHP7_9BACT|nr:DUF6520 family protein [Fulvivirgaceae bacterium BMA12]
MKNLRIVLVSSALVLAIGASYAHNSKYQRATSKATTVAKYGSFLSGCQLGTLNEFEWQCSTTPHTTIRCTVTLGLETKVAWEIINIGGLCAIPIYRTGP